MPDEEPLFVGVPDSVALRKDLLNASKSLLSSLRGYEKFNAIKNEKERYTSELVRAVKEINMLNRRIKQLLPKTRLKPGMIKKPVPVPPRIAREMPRPAEMMEAKKPARPAPSGIIEEKTRLAKLEDELAEVEEKLAKLE